MNGRAIFLLMGQENTSLSNEKYNFVIFLKFYGYHFVFLMVNNVNPGKYRKGKIGEVQSAVLCPYCRRS